MRRLFSMISPARALTLFLGMVVAVYMGFLVFSQYRSQEELRKVALNRFLHENEKRATVLSYFLSGRLSDLGELAENRELALYHENLALGMSMEYGLGVSLLATRESFERSRTRRRIEKEPYYLRLVYVDEIGAKLVDVHAPGQFEGESRHWAQYLSPGEDRPQFGFEPGVNGGGAILLSRPYTFKGRYAGQLVAWMPVDALYRHFIEVSSSDHLAVAAFVFNGEYIKVPEDAGRVIPAAQLPDLRARERNVPFSQEVAGRDGQPVTVTGMVIPVGETPFALAFFLPEVPGSREWSPRRLLFFMAGFGLLIMASGGVILWTDMRNSVLQARLKEIVLREGIIAAKNESLRKLSAAVDQSANAIITAAVDGTIEYVNPCFTTMTGYRAEEVIGEGILNRWAGHNPAEVLHALWETINDGREWTGELRSQRKDGGLFWEQATIAPVKDDQGIITSFIAVKEDITRRKEAEAEIRRLNTGLEQRVVERTAALQASNLNLEKAYDDLKAAQTQILQQEKMASIGQLAAGVAHEINNPTGFVLSNLNSLKKYVEKLAGFLALQTETLETCGPAGHEDAGEGRRLVAAQRKELKIDRILSDLGPLIEESIEGGKRITQIVQSLKSFAHVSEAENKPADINAGLENTLAMVWNELKYKATVIRDFGEIPPTVCNLGQLNQVFLNLLINAGHAIEEKGEISVKSWRQDDTIRVAVSDTGCGIPAGIIGRIFDPFFTTREVGKGTGLGLSIAYDIVVKKHQGRIEVASEPGRGTTFTVTIPIVAPQPLMKS